MTEKIISKSRIEGDLIFDGKIIFVNDCYVTGNVKARGAIRAGGAIKAGGWIEAGEWIEAEGGIQAGGAIEAGEGIKAGGGIEAEGRIKAGDGIEAGYIFSYTFDISAKKIVTKHLPFWRNYWAEMPPLRKWRSEILDVYKCWDDYPKMLTKKEKQEICAWDGWHWILKSQLEMYLGLKEEHVIQ